MREDISFKGKSMRQSLNMCLGNKETTCLNRRYMLEIILVHVARSITDSFL